MALSCKAMAIFQWNQRKNHQNQAFAYINEMIQWTETIIMYNGFLGTGGGNVRLFPKISKHLHVNLIKLHGIGIYILLTSVWVITCLIKEYTVVICITYHFARRVIFIQHWMNYSDLRIRKAFNLYSCRDSIYSFF